MKTTLLKNYYHNNPLHVVTSDDYWVVALDHDDNKMLLRRRGSEVVIDLTDTKLSSLREVIESEFSKVYGYKVDIFFDEYGIIYATGYYPSYTDNIITITDYAYAKVHYLEVDLIADIVQILVDSELPLPDGYHKEYRVDYYKIVVDSYDDITEVKWITGPYDKVVNKIKVQSEPSGTLSDRVSNITDHLGRLLPKIPDGVFYGFVQSYTENKWQYDSVKDTMTSTGVILDIVIPNVTRSRIR